MLFSGAGAAFSTVLAITHAIIIHNIHLLCCGNVTRAYSARATRWMPVSSYVTASMAWYHIRHTFCIRCLCGVGLHLGNVEAGSHRVWEVVSLNTDLVVRWVCSPTNRLVRFYHLNVPFFQNYECIYNIVFALKHSIIGHILCAFPLRGIASHVKKPALFGNYYYWLIYLIHNQGI